MTVARRPAAPGDAAAQIDTPALVLDLDAFERNLERMARATQAPGVRLRPHAKSHKCPEIARRQVALGAVGICCQKVSEAEVFADAGILDILVTNEIIGPAKLLRLAGLARRIRLGVLVDDLANLHALGELTRAHEARIDVYLEVDVGAHRCGIEPGAGAVEFARALEDYPLARFAGLHCYHGAAQHLRTPQERAQTIGRAVEDARTTRAHLVQAGFAVACITGAGTGSFPLERDSGVFQELQPGSYIFMDRDYALNEVDRPDARFEHALFIETSVMSVRGTTHAVVDAGLKSHSVDSGLPGVWQRPGIRYARPSDEHGVLELEPGTRVELGEHLRLVPGHCDPTVNLHDWLVCVRGPVVDAVWPIAARGALL